MAAFADSQALVFDAFMPAENPFCGLKNFCHAAEEEVLFDIVTMVIDQLLVGEV